MITTWLTLRDLEHVIAVAKHEHFGRAARECHISQPSLSFQIKKIEDRLGVCLFERTNRRVAITSAGRTLADQGVLILEEARKIPDMLGQASSARFETIKLGFIHTLAPLVPDAIVELKKAFPHSHLILHEGTTQDLVRELKSGVLDAVVAADTLKDDALTKFPLFFEPFILAAPKGHPILRRSRPRLLDLKASEMVLLDEGHCLRDQTLGFCPVNRRGSLRTFHATSIETLRHLVASGAGYTLLPELAAKNAPLENLVSYLKFDDEKVGRKIVLLCRGHSGNLAPFRKLVQTLEIAASK